MECCICLNNLTNDDLFFLECCKHNIHHTCLIQWINTNIDNSLPDFDKCILCKSYNSLIDDSYKNILHSRNNENENNENENENNENENNNNENENNNIRSDYVIYIAPHMRLYTHNRAGLYKLFRSICIFSTITCAVTYFMWYTLNV